MSTELFDERFARWNKLSEGVFGEPAEMEAAEAAELLRTAGIDPEQLKANLYRRMQERGENYSVTGRPLPPLLRQVLEDLRPVSEQTESETPMTRTARLAIARLLQEIREFPKLLDTGFTPAFTAAYRNRTELSAHDKEILDEITEDLRKRIGERKTHE